ncbi:LamB/YcsF family protein [Paenibacillus filicis]|uniref:5-oxoprolinase subunit A n=1 Tax=Paenibacillus gyeongsangnamensis TaxID=3388067 RepID=A0ABT4QHG4_9BACL|nr:5-oxoprolinase subunit PxpA [Paenibacillus filicis]MCZ8516318.1 LamB/YcsF family protein [Paenibacillus filicis]
MHERTVDLNGDLGESFGVYRLGQDEVLLEWVTSANIACGFHAGDQATMRRTVKLCLEKGVAIGAHPGLQDLEGFGRRAIPLTPEEAYELTVYQVGALEGFVRAEGGRLQHVKPHGALYNMAAANRPLADAIARAVYRLDPRLTLFGLAGSELICAAHAIGLSAAEEGFADRTYRPDGSLTPRTEPGAVLHDPEAAAAQALSLVESGRADTLCVHGDGPEACAMAAYIRRRLEEQGVRFRSLADL